MHGEQLEIICGLMSGEVYEYPASTIHRSRKMSPGTLNRCRFW
jgi:hypothetical protein